METVNKITDDFATFISSISLNKSTVDYIIAKHNSLTDMIISDPPEGYSVCKSRLSGSYAKHVVLNESDPNAKPDVDVILYLETDKTYVYEINNDFLTYFRDKKAKVVSEIRQQSNSIGLIYSNISVDFVLGKSNDDNLSLASYKDNDWIETNAIKQVDFMTSQNGKYNSFNYLSLMKLFKYLNKERFNKSIKSYTLEMLIHQCAPQPTVGQTLPEAFAKTLENITNLSGIEDIKDCCDNSKKGYDDKDVLTFTFFKEEISTIYDKARKALDGERNQWENIFGETFPKQPAAKVNNSSTYDKTQTPWYCDDRK